MNTDIIGPNNLFFQPKGLYVVTEFNEEMVTSEKSFKVIGIYDSFEKARNQTAFNKFRTMHGPFRVSQSFNFENRNVQTEPEYIIYQKSQYLDDKLKYDVSMPDFTLNSLPKLNNI